MTINTQDRRYPEFTIGWRLRLSRTQLGPDMDAGTFADLIGVSRNTVTNYELERVTPRKIVLNAWALATGVDIEWLRTGARPDRPNDGLPVGGVKGPAGAGWRPEQDSNLQPTGNAQVRARFGRSEAA